MNRKQFFLAVFFFLVALCFGLMVAVFDQDDPRLIRVMEAAGLASLAALLSPFLANRSHGQRSSRGADQQGSRRRSDKKDRGDSRENRELRDVLQAYYKVILEEVGRLLSASNVYDEELGAQQKKIARATSLTEVKEVIGVVTKELDGMRTTNRSLRSRLDDAQGTIADQRQNIERLSKEANFDGLTGLLNRRQFDIRHQELARVFLSRGREYGLLLGDIDHFKNINDTFGHQAGDAVLRLLGEVLPASMRKGDFAARYGGEEFAVLMQDVGRKRLVDVADKIRLAIAETRFEHEGKRIPVTISMGAAMSEEGRTEKDVLALADKALYQSKKRGRNRVSADSDLV
jgi:diguanylate cyclase (GGDEF)-like protein